MRFLNRHNSRVMLGVLAFFPASLSIGANPVQSHDFDSVTTSQKAIDKMSNLVEIVQDDIVDKLSGIKEKSIFGLADQVQKELESLEKTLATKRSHRQNIYTQFANVDTKVTSLVKAIAELSPSRPILTRDVERIRVQSDELHFLLSVGDGSKERQEQVLMRQAQSMAYAAKQFAVAADYALSDRPNGAPFIAATKKYADNCVMFEKSVGQKDLEASKKNFSALTDTWGDVVKGFRLLLPRSDYHIARLGFRVDQYHRRIFEMLKMPGSRPQLTMNL